MVSRKSAAVLLALLCAILLLGPLTAKEFRYKHYTFRKKQRLVSILQMMHFNVNVHDVAGGCIWAV